MPATAANTAVEREEARLPVRGGISLFTQSWRPQGKPKAALVIVHGLRDHSRRYAALAERLAAKGFAVHALDLRGHGGSEGDRVWVDRFDQYVDDLEAFVAQIREVEGDLPLFAFGHSMGGAIVTLWALTRKPNLKGVILSAPALKKGDEVSAFLVAVTRVLGSLFPRLPVLELPDEKFSRDPAEIAAMKADPLIEEGKGPARTAKELINAMARIGEGMAGFSYPVLLLHGTKDGLTNPEGSKALHQLAASSDKTLKLYEGAFHDLLHDTDRAQVMGYVEGWLGARA